MSNQAFDWRCRYLVVGSTFRVAKVRTAGFSVMPIKFRLKGLAETFVDQVTCDGCGNDGGEEGDEGFNTELSRVTFDGIVAVIECEHCGNIFVPEDQKHGIVDSSRLRAAVEKDCDVTGQPLLRSKEEVMVEVEKENAFRNDAIH